LYLDREVGRSEQGIEIGGYCEGMGMSLKRGERKDFVKFFLDRFMRGAEG